MERLVAQLVLERSSTRHVADREHDAVDVRVVEQVHTDDLGVDHRVVGTEQPRVDGAHRLGHALHELLEEVLHVVDRVGVEDPVEGGTVEVDREVAQHPHDRRRLVPDPTVAPDDHHGVAAVAHELLEARFAALLVELLGLHQGVEGKGDLVAEDGQALVDLLGDLVGRGHGQGRSGADPTRDRDDHDVVAAAVDEAHRPVADLVDLLDRIVDAGVRAVHLAVRPQQIGGVDRAAVVDRDPRDVSQLDAEEITGREQRDLADRRSIR